SQVAIIYCWSDASFKFAARRSLRKARIMTDEEVQSFGASISPEPFGLASYRPESHAENCYCFGNVWNKVASHGGRSVYGWTFQFKIRPEGEYLVATHHAVWCNPQGQLVDITPVHDLEMHRPLMIDGDVLFQVDSSAEPITKGNMVFPLPLKYHT